MDSILGAVGSVLGVDVSGSRVGTITTACEACDGTGTQTETRPRRIDELRNEQLSFLVDADLEEIKLSNPFVGGDDADDGREFQQQSGHTPNRDPVPGGPREVPEGRVPAPGGSIPAEDVHGTQTR